MLSPSLIILKLAKSSFKAYPDKYGSKTDGAIYSAASVFNYMVVEQTAEST